MRGRRDSNPLMLQVSGYPPVGVSPVHDDYITSYLPLSSRRASRRSGAYKYENIKNGPREKRVECLKIRVKTYPLLPLQGVARGSQTKINNLTMVWVQPGGCVVAAVVRVS